MLDSGLCKVADDTRPIVFFPLQAKKARSEMLASMFTWGQDNPTQSKYLRYGVITYGKHAKLDELGRSISQFNRKLSKWSSEVARPHGICVIFRGLEFPLKDNSESHLHANILYYPESKLTKEQWTAFLDATHSYFGTMWKDAGKIRDLRECVKYAFKPADILNATPADLRTLAEQTFNKRIMQPMGALREYRQMLKDSRKKAYFDTLKGVYDLRDIEENKKLPKRTEDEKGLCIIFGKQPLYSPYDIKGEIHAILPDCGGVDIARAFGINIEDFRLDNNKISVRTGHTRYYRLPPRVRTYLQSLHKKHVMEQIGKAAPPLPPPWEIKND